jgi:malate dehydrogenase (oxaloacetate-decarboxylating)
MFSQLAPEDIDIIVVTDGQRILGLGDLGAGGIAISIGKLCLYTLFGGIHPKRTLPIVLDVGTDNPALLNDPLYLGWRHPRVRGSEYDHFVEQFVQTIQKKFPHALLQWEDFGQEHARPLLDHYRTKICSFNDDIQGTAAVVLAALLVAVKLNQSKLEDQKIIIFGGGSAGIGICHYLLGAMEAKGISREKALATLYVIDINGLVHTGLDIPPHQRPFARAASEIKKWDLLDPSHITLLEAVKNIHPTALIGVSAQSSAFGKDIITTMCRHTERPIIFPLSNPTSKSEAHPDDLLEWTKGKAIIATGSPFGNISYQGKLFPIAQCNNVYIFPGIGLGALCCHPKEITDTMFYKAAEILSCHSPMLHAHTDTLFPSFEKLRSISREIALGVMQIAEEEGLCPKSDQKSREQKVDSVMWEPNYESENRLHFQ